MNDMRNRFLAAPTFREYLDGVDKNRDLWHGITDRVRIPEEVIAEAGSLPSKWHLLVLSEDWCGDAVNLVPVLAGLVDGVDTLELRVLPRDENLDLMDEHLTNERSRSIPIVILLDEDFVERAWWGPRPGPIQNWVMEEGLALESDERYKEIRRWYARDRGGTMLRELMDLMTVPV